MSNRRASQPPLHGTYTEATPGGAVNQASSCAATSPGVNPLQLPALALLLTCARTKLTPAQQAQLPNRLSLIRDWTQVTVLAGQHCLLPLLYWQLAHYTKYTTPTQGAELIPPAVMEQLAYHYHSNYLHSIKLGAALGKLMQAFADAQIPVLAVKGVTLAQAIYGNGALRDVGDLDLLVEPTAALWAMALLQQLGYEPDHAEPLTLNQQKAWVRFKSERHYRHPQSQIELDLHWQLVDQQSGFVLDFAALWARRTTVALNGRPIFTLGPEDGLLYLTLHGAKHGWICLKWVCDIAEYLRAYPTLDWKALQQQAAQMNATTVLRHGLALAHELLESELPAPIAAQLSSDPSPSTTTTVQYMGLLVNHRATDRTTYLLSTRQSNLRLAAAQPIPFLHKFVQRFKIFSTPTGAEIQLVSLPAHLTMLYYSIRLLRLLWELLRR